jgi:hypothetical protein
MQNEPGAADRGFLRSGAKDGCMYVLCTSMWYVRVMYGVCVMYSVRVMYVIPPHLGPSTCPE